MERRLEHRIDFLLPDPPPEFMAIFDLDAPSCTLPSAPLPRRAPVSPDRVARVSHDVSPANKAKKPNSEGPSPKRRRPNLVVDVALAAAAAEPRARAPARPRARATFINDFL